MLILMVPKEGWFEESSCGPEHTPVTLISFVFSFNAVVVFSPWQWLKRPDKYELHEDDMEDTHPRESARSSVMSPD